MKQLSKAGIISIPVVILFLLMLFLFPMWRIDLAAPQYPDGLTMNIWLNDVKGDVEIINGLNHYIGMKTIHKEDFHEFVILPAAILIFVCAGLVVLYMRRKKVYYIWTGCFLVLALYSFIDFYRWEYSYGHDLDPNAPIQVPGMTYQPPLIGYKKLLNFEVLSQPDVGGWFYIGAGLLLTGICIYEWKKADHETIDTDNDIDNGIGRLPVRPAPVDYGHDACAHCKMTIMDNRYAAEIVTAKGKVFKFDDISCLLQYPDSGKVYVADYIHPDKAFLEAGSAFFLRHEFFKSPMQGQYAAFASVTDAAALKDSLASNLLIWDDIR